MHCLRSCGCFHVEINLKTSHYHRRHHRHRSTRFGEAPRFVHQLLYGTLHPVIIQRCASPLPRPFWPGLPRCRPFAIRRLSSSSPQQRRCSPPEAANWRKRRMLMSNSSLHSVPSSGSQPEQQLQTSASVLASSKAILSRCPTKRYAIITQPGAHAHDIRGSSSPMTSLRQAARRSDVQTSLEVAEVYGALEGDYLAGLIEHECQAAGETPPHIEEITLPGLPKGKGRASVLEQNGKYIHAHLRSWIQDVINASFANANDQTDFSERLWPNLRSWAPTPLSTWAPSSPRRHRHPSPKQAHPPTKPSSRTRYTWS